MKQFQICVENHIGKIREENEDNFYCGGVYRDDLSRQNMTYRTACASEEPILLGVFDGMGGLRDGSTASHMTAQYLSSMEPERLLWQGEEEAAGLMERLNKNMCWGIDLFSRNMGTTAVLLRLGETGAQFCNVGDSRGYLFRDGVLRQLTVDHTEERAIREFCESTGVSSPERMKTMHHTLTQHLGIPESEFLIEPSVSEATDVRVGDCFLLCSDGLTNMVPDDRIREILMTEGKPEDKAKTLLDDALSAGGRDNITIVLAEVQEMKP